MVKAIEALAPFMMLNKQATNVFSKNIAMHATHVTQRGFNGITCSAFKQPEVESIATGDVEIENMDLAGIMGGGGLGYSQDSFMCRKHPGEYAEMVRNLFYETNICRFALPYII